MQKYDSTLFLPPAPVAQVVLQSAARGIKINRVPMLLDSGADITLIPAQYINQLGLETVSEPVYEIMGFDGRTSFARAINLEMIFLRKTFRGRFLLIEQPWGVIGRDVLNLLSLFLDGPKQRWQEASPPSN